MKYAILEKTHHQAVDFIKDYIQGKKVLELGSGDGDFALAMMQYADVTGVEIDSELVSKSRARGVKTLEEDFLNIDFSKYDVIFSFFNFIGMYAISQKLKRDGWHGTFISHYYPLQSSPTVPIPPDEIVDVSIDTLYFPFVIYHL